MIVEHIPESLQPAVDPSSVSKVTDPDTGEPMVVYHGTDGDFTTFNLREARQNADIPGFYFAKNEAEATEYGANVVPAFLNLRNPQENPPPVQMQGDSARRALEDGGVDGVMRYEDSLQDTDLVEFIAFRPNQIKSATGNVGTFDPASDSILQQRTEDTRRGAFNPETLNIELLAKVDLSTFLHETGHLFLTVYTDLASQADAPSAIRQDMQTLLD